MCAMLSVCSIKRKACGVGCEASRGEGLFKHICVFDIHFKIVFSISCKYIVSNEQRLFNRPPLQFVKILASIVPMFSAGVQHKPLNL